MAYYCFCHVTSEAPGAARGPLTTFYENISFRLLLSLKFITQFLLSLFVTSVK